MNLTGAQRVLQIHPTLRCNLRCLHCYSASGPDRDDALPLALLAEAVVDAADCGYEVVAVSGGEPLLYPDLPALLDAARAAGLRTTLTSNGTLLTAARLEAVAPRLDLLAISLDGVPESHDRIRGRRGVFESLERNLAAVRDTGVPFGFIFTLTQHNVHELDWIATFAADQGARLLQIHPLEMAGRAATGLAAAHPDVVELGVAFAEMLRLEAEMAGRMVVHLDVASRPAMVALAAASTGGSETARLADVVSPLVIEADGAVVPLTFGFPRGFALGDLHTGPLRELGARWLDEQRNAYEALLTRLLDDRAWPEALPLVNVYEAAVALAAS